MKALLYLQVAAEAPWPQVQPLVLKVKQHVPELEVLELDNFSRPELVQLAGRWVAESHRLAVVLELAEDAPGLGNLLPLLRQAALAGHPVWWRGLTEPGRILRVQLTAAGVKPVVFSQEAVQQYLFYGENIGI